MLLIAEKVGDDATDEPIRFVTLKRPISQLTAGKEAYWSRFVQLVDDIEGANSSIENDRYRIKLVDPEIERLALSHDRTRARNWSKYIRAPLSYYEIFEGVA